MNVIRTATTDAAERWHRAWSSIAAARGLVLREVSERPHGYASAWELEGEVEGFPLYVSFAPQPYTHLGSLQMSSPVSAGPTRPRPPFPFEGGIEANGWIYPIFPHTPELFDLATFDAGAEAIRARRRA